MGFAPLGGVYAVGLTLLHLPNTDDLTTGPLSGPKGIGKSVGRFEGYGFLAKLPGASRRACGLKRVFGGP